MYIKYNNKEYEIIITYKNIKNMYLRVKEDLNIYISSPLNTSKKVMELFVNKNYIGICKMIDNQIHKNERIDGTFILGIPYELVICNTFKEVVFDNNKVFIKNKKEFDKYIKARAIKEFTKRLDICYNLFDEVFDYPLLKVKNMKGKWGYCSKRDNLIVLSTNLIKYSISEIDYVIIHELSHLVHFNHSRNFWNLVSKYKPDYKINKQVLKEE
ncbi:MAG: YgjP-like metallopeptidase domain-containing protein [Bacilli bacterium]